LEVCLADLNKVFYAVVVVQVLLGEAQLQLAGKTGEMLDAAHLVVFLELLFEMIEVLHRQELLDHPAVLVLWTQQ